MIYRSTAVVFGEIGFAWIAFVGYGFGFWMPPFFQRVHGVSVAQAGTVLGLSAPSAVGSASSRRRHPLRLAAPAHGPGLGRASGIITALIAVARDRAVGDDARH